MTAWVIGLLARLAVGLVVAVVVAWLAHRWVLPAFVWRAYRRHLPHHRLAPPDASEGAGAEHVHYLSMTYDCRVNDVIIEGVAPSASYWQWGAADRYARPVDHAHCNHRTVPVSEAGTYRLRLSTRESGEPGHLCVADAPRGLLVYRVLLPTEPVPVPEVRVVPTPR